MQAKQAQLRFRRTLLGTCDDDAPSVLIYFDDDGFATRFELADDGGVLPPEIEACLRAFFREYCYPSLAGGTGTLSPHCWIA